MLAGEGMSQVVRSLQELLARRTYYSGDLLFSVDILRNVTDTFKRATYVPSADDVQVPPRSPCWRGGELRVRRRRDAASLGPCGGGVCRGGTVAVRATPWSLGLGLPDSPRARPSASSRW